MHRPSESVLRALTTAAALMLVMVGALFCFAPLWQPGIPANHSPLPQPAAISATAAAAPVDVNTATEEELMALPGIGEVRAAAIVAWREEHGPFADLQEVTALEGISARMVESWQGLAVADPVE